MTIVITTIVLAALSFFMGKWRTQHLCKAEGVQARSLPGYYGWCSLLWCLIPLGLLYAGFLAFSPKTPVYIVVFTISVIALSLASILSYSCLQPQFNARKHLEKWGKLLLFCSASISIIVTIAIVLSVLFESVRFFAEVPLHEFLFGTTWSPQTALRADQAGSSGSFGAIPVFVGTLLITLIAMLVAAPLGLFSAIYLSEYASKRLRHKVKPALEILAGIPTVVYGYFAAVTIGPFFRDIGEFFNLSIASESALAAGLIMGVMIIPFIMSLSDDIINAIPQSLREASFGLGATQSETIRHVVIPSAFPGIMSACLLGVSRAIGETMIVVMAAGLAANLTVNPLDSVTTVTVQIVTLLVGDQEFDSAKTLAAFALGLTLFVLTLLLNIIALLIVKKYKETYV